MEEWRKRGSGEKVKKPLPVKEVAVGWSVVATVPWEAGVVVEDYEMNMNISTDSTLYKGLSAYRFMRDVSRLDGCGVNRAGLINTGSPRPGSQSQDGCNQS